MTLKKEKTQQEDLRSERKAQLKELFIANWYRQCMYCIVSTGLWAASMQSWVWVMWPSAVRIVVCKVEFDAHSPTDTAMSSPWGQSQLGEFCAMKNGYHHCGHPHSQALGNCHQSWSWGLEGERQMVEDCHGLHIWLASSSLEHHSGNRTLLPIFCQSFPWHELYSVQWWAPNELCWTAGYS